MIAYLDHSATTPPSGRVCSLVSELLESGWYNPSALYKPAMIIQKKLNEVRTGCMKACGADGNRVIFTSGGTEADNLGILGTLRGIRGGGKVLLSSVEHPAVLACADEIRRLGFQPVEIPVGRDSRIDRERFEKLLDQDVKLIAVMQVNNETGAIQPLREIAELRDRFCPDAAIHVDGVQGFLRVPIQFNRLKIQSYAFSGHKIQALKGIGGLIVQKNHPLKALQFGGGQESNERSGTENTLGILSMGEAVSSYPEEANNRMAALKKRLWFGISGKIPTAVCNGPECDSPFAAPHILNISLEPVRSQTMLFALEGDRIYVSAGSACSSRKQKISPVLKACGMTTARADCALRFSLGPDTSEEQIDYTVDRVAYHYEILKNYVRR